MALTLEMPPVPWPHPHIPPVSHSHGPWEGAERRGWRGAGARTPCAPCSGRPPGTCWEVRGSGTRAPRGAEAALGLPHTPWVLFCVLLTEQRRSEDRLQFSSQVSSATQQTLSELERVRVLAWERVRAWRGHAAPSGSDTWKTPCDAGEEAGSCGHDPLSVLPVRSRATPTSIL